MANIVTLPSTGTRYLVDVGFGSQGPTAPLPLIHGSVTCGIGAQQLRLEYKRVVPHTQRSQRLWVYSHRNGPNEAWTDAYAFSETEFFPQDFELINYGIMTLRNSFFTQAVLCARFVLDNEDGKAADNGGPGISEVVGVRSLIGNTITLKIKERFQDFASAEDAAEYETVMLVWTEDERVEALEKWFNVRLTPQERKGIIGLSSQLRGKKTPMISNT